MTSDRIGQMFREAIELDADGRGQLLATLPVSEREQLEMLLDADSHGEDSGLFESLDQEVDPTEPSSLTNKRIRDYELLEVIGEGGMGTVYRALHSRLKCDVALKVLPLNKVKQADTIAWFEREMSAVGQLRHPNIVQAMDAGEERGLHYLVLEFIDGTNVAAISRSAGQMSVADACEIIRQTALGLSHAHSRGLIHRDIKPSNLLISKQGDVCIADMGLAMLQADSSDLTSAGQIMGTLDYIAPEQMEFSTDGGETFGEPINLTKARYEHIDNFVTPVTFDAEHEANVVRMTITSNHYDSSLHGGDRVGLNEVRFLAADSQ
jgi:serine/threonine protein kinase